MTEVIAYLDDNKEWTKEEIVATDLTCINYAFANIIGLEIVRDLKKIHLINELKAEHPHLKTCISIGGWSADGFSEGVATKENRQILIKNLIAYMQKYQFDGIDLDWEYPGMDIAGIKASEDDAQNFLFFVQELRSQLDELGAKNQKSYWLTTAIGAEKKLLDTMSPNDRYEYIDFLDFVNVMTYDMRGSFTKTAGHHTNLASYSQLEGELSTQQAVKNLQEKGVPADKIVIGAAFYSRMWTGFPKDATHPVGCPAETFGNQTENYHSLKNKLANHPEYVFWDDEAKASYYFDGQEFISYDDAQSMKEKARYVKENNLRGLMFWEYSLELVDLLPPAAEILLR
ncbi:chitinase [Enterococcus sp. DIV2402]|uniref:chitinase n=1 Tax=Candidatus Enterococcus lowellii TaxID=2230877 RepID=A0ABZ2SRB3_9ENTE|nr:glycoside hydrolase family 18 protein [Enterococcus sp. DIV2402]MBO0465023.1 glycoside hydrolase family 18 protein [Enterococcus sp. DIV2402]